MKKSCFFVTNSLLDMKKGWFSVTTLCRNEKCFYKARNTDKPRKNKRYPTQTLPRTVCIVIVWEGFLNF
jgi:hypothetical protein